MTPIRRALVWLVWTPMGSALVVMQAGCNSSEDADAPRPADFGFQQPVETALVAQGKAAFERYCSGCHGINGDGQGESAVFLNPKPRNFQLADFKFSWTRSGELPTDEDIKRTIREGLKGSAMPPWKLLPDQTLDALIAYIKTFSPAWKEVLPASRIPMVEDPYMGEEDESEAVARGEAVYHGFASCWVCHPAYVSEQRLNEHLVTFGSEPRAEFRPDLHNSIGKANTAGDILFPPDFRRDFVRSGSDLEDLYRVIGAGVTGAAMPTWIDSVDIPGEEEGDPPLVEPSDIWAMAYYVRNLIVQRPARLTEDRIVLRDRPQKIDLHGAPAPSPAVEEEEEFEE